MQFPADKYSISYTGRLNGEDVDQIVDAWKRPREFCSNPEMIKDGAGADDVNQGSLGDCYMVAAMACISERKVLFEVRLLLFLSIQTLL